MKSKVIALTLMLLAISSQNNMTLEISCEDCAVTCAYSKCFRLKGEGIDTQICSESQTCSLDQSHTVVIGSSTTDMSGNPCSSGMAVYLPNPVPLCATTTDCTTETTVTIQCGDCAVDQNCTKCSQTVDNGQVTGETCIGDTCEGMGNTQLTVAACNGGKDALGETCACCETMVSTTSTGGLSTCFEKVTFLNNDYVTTWYTKQASSEGGKNNQQTLIIVGSLTLLLISMILY